jgi:hypothetical protein
MKDALTSSSEHAYLNRYHASGKCFKHGVAHPLSRLNYQSAPAHVLRYASTLACVPL